MLFLSKGLKSFSVFCDQSVDEQADIDLIVNNAFAHLMIFSVQFKYNAKSFLNLLLELDFSRLDEK